jgi:hypothetical protein
MAVSFEDLRHLQAGFPPERYSFRRPEMQERESLKTPFLDGLDHELDRRLYDVLPSELNISVFKPNTLKILRVSEDPILRREIARPDTSRNPHERIVVEFQNNDMQDNPDGDGGSVEAGMNWYIGSEGRSYPTPITWGSYNEFHELAHDITRLDQEGKDTTLSEHSQPEDAVPSRQDLLNALRMKPNGRPYFNAFTIHTKQAQLYAQRTADSHALLPHHKVVEKGREWFERYNMAGAKERAERELAVRDLLGDRRRRIEEEYNTYIRAAQEQVLVEFADLIAWKFYLSSHEDNMEIARAMPPSIIFPSLRTGEKPVFPLAA